MFDQNLTEKNSTRVGLTRSDVEALRDAIQDVMFFASHGTKEISEHKDAEAAWNTFETLTRHPIVVPGEDATTWTFKLRKSAFSLAGFFSGPPRDPPIDDMRFLKECQDTLRVIVAADEALSVGETQATQSPTAAGLKNPGTRNPVQWAGTNRGSFAIVFTDIVDSTGQKKKIGDTRWGEIIGKHFSCSHELITRHEGCLVKTTGDGVLAIFRTAGEALEFSLAIACDTGEPLIKLRASIHVGEIDLSPDDIQGLAVDLAKRVQEIASPTGIMVSDRAHGDILQTARNGHRDLPWQDEGERRLKGIGTEKLWSVFVVTD